MALLLSALVLGTPSSAAAAGITARELGILINTNDPQSIAVGAYYQQRRFIPEANVIRLSLPTGRDNIRVDDFRKLKAEIDRRTPAAVQAFAVTWVEPYRVGCMSLNTAITIEYHPSYCALGCRLTRTSAYYDSVSHAPAAQLGIRPTMSLAARSVAEAKALIDRGIASDGTFPMGTAYLLSTSDRARNVRALRYGSALDALQGMLHVEISKADSLRNRKDVLFYFTGLARVPDIATNRFLPGAVADHLTSFGGDLLGRRQMSILDWISAGATGSYGTVLEPCSFPGKFPDVAVMMRRYAGGETLIESYWKSVLMPGQGIFIGEPLARPFSGR